MLGVFSDEVPTLRNLLEEELDGFLVRLDGLQGLGTLNERKDVAHGSRQADDPVIAILLVYEYLSGKSAPVRMSSNTQTWFAADITDQANDVYG